MWSIILMINGILLAIESVFFVYSIGAALILGEWKQLLIAFLLWIFLFFAEVAIGAIVES